MTLTQIASFGVRWLGAYAVAVAAMVLALLAIAVAPPLIFGSEDEELLEFARDWTALFWYALFLLPLVAAVALPFAAGFSLVAELNGIEIHAARYTIMGAGAGLIVGWLTTPRLWAGLPWLDFAIAGGIGGLILASLHWGRFGFIPKHEPPRHEF